jgi:hypothetical protein
MGMSNSDYTLRCWIVMMNSDHTLILWECFGLLFVFLSYLVYNAMKSQINNKFHSLQLHLSFFCVSKLRWAMHHI